MKSRKWYRRRNKGLFPSSSLYVAKWWQDPRPFPPPLDAERLESLCDADRATWENKALLLLDRFLYTVQDVLQYHEAHELDEAVFADLVRGSKDEVTAWK